MFCLKCGKENPDTATTCGNCSARLSSAPAASDAAESLKRAGAELSSKLGLLRVFMRKSFPLVLNCFLVLCILGVTLLFLNLPSSPYEPGSVKLMKFVLYIMSLGGVIVSFGLMYTLLDIRDELETLNKNFRDKA